MPQHNILAVLIKTIIYNVQYHGLTLRAKGIKTMAFSINFNKTSKNSADLSVIGVFENSELTASAKEFNKEHNGSLAKCLKNHQNFNGKIGESISLMDTKKAHAHIVIIGLGKKDKLDNLAIETIGGKLLSVLEKSGANNIDIFIDGFDVGKKSKAAVLGAHLALGLQLKSYNFLKYKSAPKADKKNKAIDKINIITAVHLTAKNIYADYAAIAEGVFLARDLVNEPPNHLYPESYADIIKKQLKPLGVDVEILDEKKMQKMGFGALLAVGQGSIRQSQVVIMKWNGAAKTKKNPIALVGKGVTFDTGGISLKAGAEMDLMKMDMGGSAVVVGTIKALAKRKSKSNVIGIVGLVENMPSDRAYRPGDILTSHSGKTIEVLNTDAEGRLVLADILTYIQDTYKPEVIIDLATLTGAIMVALGFEYCGAFANDDKLWEQLKQASDNTGEKFWRMPLDEAYRKEMESEVADLKNLGSLGRYGGACSAAGFLEHFIHEGTKWAHIDIAGTAWWKSDKPTTPKGGTGFAVRALNDLIENHFEKK